MTTEGITTKDRSGYARFKTQEQGAVVQAWIQEVEEKGLEDGEFLRVRGAALGYFNRIRPELQILLWQRNPQGTIRLPTTVNQARLRAVAQIYF